ncbi:MAG: Bax inhibitor-1/YccA family protein [Ruminococcus sp.]|nr:Bax inhibitor-1/YccA family protein [Ruminococcus sp.]
MNRLSNQGGGTAAKTKSSFLRSNPIMRRLDNVTEVDETNSATYKGIALKTAFFLLFCVAGILLQLALVNTLSAGDLIEFSVRGFDVSMYSYELYALIGSVILAIVFQLLAFFAKATTPVTGALYCVTQGYMISFLIFKVLRGYEYLGALALAITLTIVLVMSILYATGAIRVTKKFKMVMLTLFVTSIASSILVFIGSLIPATRELVAAITGNIVFSLVSGVIFIIIAALFLICDFDTIDHVVSDKLPKKYEWAAAFGLAFTVLWLYLKVLDIIMTIAGNKRD